MCVKRHGKERDLRPEVYAGDGASGRAREHVAGVEYVSGGRRRVVDMDLEKFFDRVNHDIPMSRVARKIGDKRVLEPTRRYPEAGMMVGRDCIATHGRDPAKGVRSHRC